MREYILIVLAVLALALIIFIGIKEKKIKRWVYDLVVEAENTFIGTKRGKDRLMFVIDRIQEVIPAWARWYFTDERLIKWIEEAVKLMKQALQKPS